MVHDSWMFIMSSHVVVKSWLPETYWECRGNVAHFRQELGKVFVDVQMTQDMLECYEMGASIWTSLWDIKVQFLIRIGRDRDKSRDREREREYCFGLFWNTARPWQFGRHLLVPSLILFSPFPFSHFDSGATGYCGPSRSTKADLPRCGTNVSAPMQCASLGRCHGQCRDARWAPALWGWNMVKLILTVSFLTFNRT